MFESAMRSAGVDQECQCKLVDVPKSLDRWGIHDISIHCVDPDEDVNGVTNLVEVLHRIAHPGTAVEVLSTALFLGPCATRGPNDTRGILAQIEAAPGDQLPSGRCRSPSALYEHM